MEESISTPPPTNSTNTQLIEIARWAKYCAIVGMISMVGVGIQLISGPLLSAFVVGSEVWSEVMGIVVLYLLSLLKLAYIYPLYQLLQFSNTMLAVAPDQEKALLFLYRFFKWFILCSLILFLSGVTQSGFGLFSLFALF